MSPPDICVDSSVDERSREILNSVGAPPSVQGLGLIARRVQRLTDAFRSEELDEVSGQLAEATERISSTESRQTLFSLSETSRFGRLSNPQNDASHPFRDKCMTAAPLWTVLAVQAPKACRSEWLFALAEVTEAAVRIQRARIAEGELGNSEWIFGRAQSAISEACRSLRKIAEKGHRDLEGVKPDFGLPFNGLCDQLIGKERASPVEASKRIAKIISLLRLAEKERDFGHGGKAGARRSATDVLEGGGRLAPPGVLTSALPKARAVVEVEGNSMWESESGDDQVPLNVSWRLLATKEEIAALDAAPEEYAVDAVTLVERPCTDSAPIATVAAKAHARKRALARQAIPSRYELRELTITEMARFRNALLTAPDPDSPEFPKWFVGAVVALSGCVAPVYCSDMEEHPSHQSPIVYRAASDEWVVYSPHPQYQRLLEEDQRMQSRTTSTSLVLPALRWLSRRAMQMWGKTAGVPLPVPKVREILDHFGLDRRKTLSAMARPLALAIRDLSGDGVNIGLITGEMPRDGRTQSYYTTRSADFLADLHAKAVERAFGIKVERVVPDVRSDVFHGAFRCPLDETVASLIRQLQNDVAAFALASDEIQHHNALTAYVAVVISIGIAGRAKIDPAPDEMSLGELVYVLSDKDGGNDYHTRAGSIPRLVADVVRAYRAHRYAIERTIAHTSKETLPFLFLLDDCRVPRPFRPSDLKLLAPQFALPISALRRWVRTRLVEAGVAPSLVDAYLGHWILGREAWHPFSGLSLLDLAAQVVPQVENLLAESGVTVLCGLSP